jgi:DNA-directed RNA polymerase subunit RPC12/RpoP
VRRCVICRREFESGRRDGWVHPIVCYVCSNRLALVEVVDVPSRAPWIVREVSAVVGAEATAEVSRGE